MKILVLYISVTTDPMPFPPESVRDLHSDDVKLFDLDQNSGPEVVSAATEAIGRAELIILGVNIQAEHLGINMLFPVFRKLSKNASRTRWFQAGNHAGLRIFRNYFMPEDMDTGKALASRLVQEMTNKM